MAEGAKAGTGSLSKANISKEFVENGQLDPASLRIGKQRLVSAKKKKTSTLKKLILAEREVRATDTSLWPAPVDGTTIVTESSSGFSVDAPEFIPDWLPSSSFAGNEADAATTTPQAEERKVPAANASDGKKRTTGRMMTAVPEFVPSWCQPSQPAGDDVFDSVTQPEKTAPTPSAALPLGEALERVKEQAAKDNQSKVKQPKQPKTKNANLEVRHYVHQVLSDELDEKVKAMLAELVRFQERARERDPLKFQKQKRFCIGMREAARSVTRGKAKCLIMAPNMEMSQTEGGLDEAVEDLIDSCRENEVPVVFALSRNRMGKALGKNIRLSLICVLSAEGVHQEFRQIVRLTEDLRRQWVMRKMALGLQEAEVDEPEDPAEASEASALTDGEAIDAAKSQRFGNSISARVMKHLEEKKAEEDLKRAAEKEQRDAERAVEKARRAAERKVKQEERRQARLAEAEAQKEEELRKQEEEEAEEARKIEAAFKEAERQAEIRRKENQRRAEEERKRQEEIAAKEALKQKEAEANAIDLDDDDDDDELPLGFNSDFF